MTTLPPGRTLKRSQLPRRSSQGPQVRPRRIGARSLRAPEGSENLVAGRGRRLFQAEVRRTEHFVRCEIDIFR